MLVRCILVECNCNQHACYLIAEFKKPERCSRPASLVKLLQKKRLVSDMCVGRVQHNQTCVILNMTADPVAMMTGLMV